MMSPDYVQLEDGFYYFWQKDKGAIAPYQLRQMADELDKLNEPLQQSIDAYFAANPVEGESR